MVKDSKKEGNLKYIEYRIERRVEKVTMILVRESDEDASGYRKAAH